VASPAGSTGADAVLSGHPDAGPAAVAFTGRSPAAVSAGDAVEHAGIRVIGLPWAGDGVAVVAATGGTAVLWAPSPGPPPDETLHALNGAGLKVIVLGVGASSGGGATAESLGRTLATLRRIGAPAPECDVVALTAKAANGRLHATLAEWGVRPVFADATDDVPLGPAHAVRATPPRRTLVLGPAGSGKSRTAEAMLVADPEVAYLPTGAAPGPDDDEWAERIRDHRRRRPEWWSTLEGADPAAELARPGPPLLIDSTGTWVASALDRCGAWDDDSGWRTSFESEVDELVLAWRTSERRVVAVGEETGWGVIPSSSSGRRFRDALGRLHQRLAADSERVLLVVAGRTLTLGEEAVGD
jgi:adenosylcobinamide kinase/adenosylcobinamide-phosphate guanylyltransferase